MGYIGKTPTPAPLTSSDIAADIINSTHIGDTAISGFDALATAPAGTDEFLISDAGVLKRLDASLVGGGKLLQSSLVTTSTNQAISSTSYADLTGMTLDITPVSSTSKFLITSFMNIGFTVSSSADESFFSQILRDSTVVNNADTSVGYGSIYYYSGDASNLHIFDVNVCEDDHNTSSQVTIKVQGKTASGQSIQFNLNSSKKSYLLVQEIET
jgi:hypothetical protein